MKGRVIVLGVLILLAFGTSVLAGGPCPLGSIESDSEIVSGTKMGMIAVEACLTRLGGQDTYTYRVTNLGLGATNVCGLLVTGAGKFTTVSTGTPAGWLGNMVDTLDVCTTWWTWSALSRAFGAGGLGPGETATFSMTLAGPTTPAMVSAKLAPCDGGDMAWFQILGPSACPDVTMPGSLQSCVCTARGCSSVLAFEGEGTRIQLLGGPDVQFLGNCDASWVRHGFVGEGASTSDSEFRLYIDGVPVPLKVEEICVATSEPGGSATAVHYYVQFPELYFLPGVYELRGEWEIFPTAEDPAGFVFDRTIQLVVDLCLLEPLPVTPVPDLTIVLLDPVCECGWTQLNTRECEIAIPLVVKNEGDAASGPSSIRLRAQQRSVIKAIPELKPGEEYEMEVDLSFRIDPEGAPPCPVEVTAEVDFADMVEESDELNNADEVEVCCKQANN